VNDPEYEAWFIEQVRKGREQAERGELIDHEEVGKRIEKRLQDKQSDS